MSHFLAPYIGFALFHRHTFSSFRLRRLNMMDTMKAANLLVCLLATATPTVIAQTQMYNGYVTQSDTSDIVNLGLDQATFETLINENKDGDMAAAEAGFAAGEDLYTGVTPGMSTKVFQDLATDVTFFQDGAGTFASFQKFVDYHGGNDQYMDVSVLAALNGVDADFSAGGGPNFEYSVYNPRGRADVAEKATNYLIIVQMIQGSLENALKFCKAGNADEAVDSLDEAVAYYVGSEMLNGPFFFNLAVARCGNFETCEEDGTAPVNNFSFEQFNALRDSLRVESSEAQPACPDSEAAVNAVIAKMAVPLVQGTIRYAVFLGLDGDTDDKSQGEGAIFAQSCLPYIQACDPSAASIVFENMKPVAGDPNVDYFAVVEAFESTYECLGITAEEIGCYEGRADAGCEGGPTTAPPPTSEGTPPANPPTADPPTASPPTETSSSPVVMRSVSVMVAFGALALLVA